MATGSFPIRPGRNSPNAPGSPACSEPGKGPVSRRQHEIKAAKGVSPLLVAPECLRASEELGARALPAPWAQRPATLTWREPGSPGTAARLRSTARAGSQSWWRRAATSERASGAGSPCGTGRGAPRLPLCALTPGAERTVPMGHAEAVALLCPAQPTAGRRTPPSPAAPPCVLARPEVAATPETERHWGRPAKSRRAAAGGWSRKRCFRAAPEGLRWRSPGRVLSEESHTPDVPILELARDVPFSPSRASMCSAGWDGTKRQGYLLPCLRTMRLGTTTPGFWTRSG